MEEAMSHTAHSQYGTDDRVKLPNLTDEEVNWQELEDLYSINESLYECRPDYSPGPDNWANFQKDVDNMFALRHVFNTFNQTHELDDSTLPELGSGAGGGGLQEGSGEDVWPGLATETRLTTPAPYETPPAATQDGDLGQVVNDLPDSGTSALMEPPSGPSRGPALLQRDMWPRQLEEIEGDIFSGNGLTELETRHDSLLRTHNSLQAAAGQTRVSGPHKLDPEDEEDIFQAQGYLPFFPQTQRPKLQASDAWSPPATQTGPLQSVGLVLKVPPQPALPLSSDYEGSGSPPQPSNQTL